MRSMSGHREDLLEIEKAKAHVIIEVAEYIPNAVLSKTILRKATGNITLMAFDMGEELADRISPFDTFIQIIDGAAEIVIDKKIHHLKLGHGIIIPAHTLHRIDANEPFKMLSTVIKSGYEL